MNQIFCKINIFICGPVIWLFLFRNYISWIWCFILISIKTIKCYSLFTYSIEFIYFFQRLGLHEKNENLNVLIEWNLVYFLIPTRLTPWKHIGSPTSISGLQYFSTQDFANFKPHALCESFTIWIFRYQQWRNSIYTKT